MDSILEDDLLCLPPCRYGASVTSWVHQHVVQHHIHTNDIHLDPDIEGKYVMRLNPLKPLLK